MQSFTNKNWFKTSINCRRLTWYGSYTAFSFGLAKQSSLSSTTALISGFCPSKDEANANDIGIGRWLNVDIVACGRRREGFWIHLKALRVAETFIETDQLTTGKRSRKLIGRRRWEIEPERGKKNDGLIEAGSLY